jgi:SAM-dependent methyltransferase
MNSSQPVGFYDHYWRTKSVLNSTDYDDLEVSLVFSQAKPGMTCLDYGCGEGRMGLKLQGLRYRGFDISSEAVKRGRDRGIQVELLSSEGKTNLETGSCDLALCFEVFEHLYEPEIALREIVRALKPGGVLLASVPNAGNWVERLRFLVTGFWVPGGCPGISLQAPWNDPHIRFFNPQILRRFILREAFERVEIISSPFSLASLPYVYRKKRLSALAGRISRPFGWISRLAPGLFASRIFVKAIRIKE